MSSAQVSLATPPIELAVATAHEDVLARDRETHSERNVGEQDSSGSEHSEVEMERHGLTDLSVNTEMGDENQAADDVVGFSISRTATWMKSPSTPAAEKSKALDSSKSYFASDSLGTIDESQFVDAEVTHLSTSSDDSMRLQTHDERPPTPPPLEVSTSPEQLPVHDEYPDRRRSVIAEAFALTRRRASSASAMVAESLKRLLPESPRFPTMPSPSTNRLSGSGQQDTRSRGDSARSNHTQGYSWGYKSAPISAKARNEVVTGAGSNTDVAHSRSRSITVPTTVRRSSSEHRRGLNRAEPDEDGAAASVVGFLKPGTPQLRRRSASADSLFLQKTATGASKWDDPAVFQTITEQTNSRFKAITDTLADSNFRLPKLPGINLAALRPFVDRLNVNEPKQNGSTRALSATETDTRGGPALGRKGDAATIEYTGPNQRAHPILAEALEKTTGDIVVMGGYRGSILRDAKPPHRQLWAPVKVGLNIRKVDLEVGLNDSDEERMEEKIIPSGTLSHIGPIDICRRLLRHLHKAPNYRNGILRVHDYGYDWRLSPHRLCRRLILFLEKLECNQPSTPPKQRGAWIIAHSLGGLIVRHAVNQRPELFAGIVYAGTPQHAVNILGPLRNGDDVLMSSRVLTAQVNFTLRTSFALLPLEGRCFFDKDTGERLDLDFFDPETWEEHRLSPCVGGPPEPAATPSSNRESKKSIVDILTEAMPLPSNLRTSILASASTTTSTPDDKKENPSAQQPSLTQRAEEDLKQTLLEPSMSTPQNPISIQSSTPHNNHHKHHHHTPPSIATHCTLPPLAAKAYLTRTLAATKTFKQATNHLPHLTASNAYPPHAILYSAGTPTVLGARVSGGTSAIRRADAYDDLIFGAGDGVVLASAAQLPLGYRCVKGGRVESARGHVGLLGDLEGVGRCLGSVVGARVEGGVGLGVGGGGGGKEGGKERGGGGGSGSG